jgi:hypothetical protein
MNADPGDVTNLRTGFMGSAMEILVRDSVVDGIA